MPPIVYAELLVGVELADNRKRAAARRARIDALRGKIPIVEFGAGAAERWSNLYGRLVTASAPPGTDSPP